MKAFPYPELKSKILFLNIGFERETYFNWVNESEEVGFTQIDILGARNFSEDPSDYIHLVKKGQRLVFQMMASPERGFTKALFVVGAKIDCQYQVMEAILEYFASQWYLRYDELLRGPSVDARMFEDFAEVVEAAFEEVPKNYLQKLLVRCPQCDANYFVFVRTSLVQSAVSFPMALVYQHANHALLIYVDEQYESRGESIVNITG